MALNSANVRIARTGAVSVAPTGTAAPTSATSTLNAALKDLGYLSDDGITESRDISTTAIQAWQNADTVRKIITDSSWSFKFTLIENKVDTVQTFYGTTVNTTTGSYIVVPGNSGGRKMWVLDVVDSTLLRRIYVPQGEITDWGDVVYSNGGDPIGYEVTVTTYPDTTINGNGQVWDTALAS